MALHIPRVARRCQPAGQRQQGFTIDRDHQGIYAVPRLTRESPTLAEATRTWMRIGLLSFGGPAGQIAVMHRILVEEKRWIGESRFLHALNYCMLLPGPEAQQLATYIGWLMHGARGGMIAGVLFVLPGVIALMALSFIYVLWHRQPFIEGALLGLKAAVIALVIEALVRIAKRALRTAAARALAAISMLAIILWHVPFPAIIVGAGIFGYVAARRGHAFTTPASQASAAPDDIAGSARLRVVTPTPARAARLLALFVPLWFAPVVTMALVFGTGHVFTQLGTFFSKMAVVTFGGAYAVLTYVAQQAVDRFGWVSPAQMMDGLGLAESTPGPLIMVVQFVGFLAAYQAAGGSHPLLAGTLGALLTVWVTFVPCFLWIFLGAPYVERLRNDAALSSALAAITAAVVGVIANLALWFAMHVLFARVSSWSAGDLVRVDVPAFASLRAAPATLTAVALLMMFALRQGLARCLLVCALLGALAALRA
jgi:chromate transporter